MKNLLILTIGLLVGAGGVWLISHNQHAGETEAAAKPSEEVSGGDGNFKLTPEQQKAAGIEVAKPEPATLTAQIKGYGRVLDPAPIISLKLDMEAARAAVDASKKEFERVKTLYAQNRNASARALETAEAALKRDQAQLALAQARLETALGPGLTHRDDVAEIFDPLLNFQAVLFRFDLLSPPPEPLPTNIYVAPLINETSRFAAGLLGPAPLAETALQGRGFLGVLRTIAIPPNTAIAVWLADLSRPQSGFVVPASAVLQEGSNLVLFVKEGENEFRKVAVELGQQPTSGAFVTNGLVATNLLVVQGAHQLLSISHAEPAE